MTFQFIHPDDIKLSSIIARQKHTKYNLLQFLSKEPYRDRKHFIQKHTQPNIHTYKQTYMHMLESDKDLQDGYQHQGSDKLFLQLNKDV